MKYNLVSLTLGGRNQQSFDEMMEPLSPGILSLDKSQSQSYFEETCSKILEEENSKMAIGSRKFFLSFEVRGWPDVIFYH